jgi:cytochrome c5
VSRARPLRPASLAQPWRVRLGTRLFGVLLTLTVAGVSAQTRSPAAADGALPDGAGAEVLRARCLSCHGSDLIASQSLNEAGWGREIDKMVRWGATVSEADRPALLGYLSAHFAPAPVTSHSRAAEGETVFKRACLTCHLADLTEQQRLSPAGWTREVEKMMRWGAVVSEAEKPALVDYLSTRYPMR